MDAEGRGLWTYSVHGSILDHAGGSSEVSKVPPEPLWHPEEGFVGLSQAHLITSPDKDGGTNSRLRGRSEGDATDSLALPHLGFYEKVHEKVPRRIDVTSEDSDDFFALLLDFLQGGVGPPGRKGPKGLMGLPGTRGEDGETGV